MWLRTYFNSNSFMAKHDLLNINFSYTFHIVLCDVTVFLSSWARRLSVCKGRQSAWLSKNEKKKLWFTDSFYHCFIVRPNLTNVIQKIIYSTLTKYVMQPTGLR